MSEELDRDNLIGLLEKLGSESDEEVLSAARAISVQVSESGQSWDELLAEPELQDAEWDADEEVDEEVDEDDSTSSEESAAGDSEALSLIGKLLSKPGLYEGTRQELEGYKEDIAEGEFTGADRKYLRVLHKRVAKGK
jgi:hypothetical protein